MAGRLVPQQLEREIEAQVRVVSWTPGCRSRTWTRTGTCTSSHRFAERWRRVLPRLEIRRVRAVQDVYLSRPLAQPDLLARPSLGDSIRRVFETTEHFLMPSK